MMGILKIYLKNKENPLKFTLPIDQIMDFTDWLNRNNHTQNNSSMFVFDFPNDKHFAVFRSHVQGFHFSPIGGEKKNVTMSSHSNR